MPKRYSSVVIDGVTYLPADEVPLEDEARKLLSQVYGFLWTEVYYDPFNEETRKFAMMIEPKMKRLNEILGFKE